MNSILSALAKLLDSLFGQSTPPPPASSDPPLQPLTPRVLTLIWDPIVDPAAGTRLLATPYAEYWNKVDDLLQGYIADIAECSGGLVQYREVARQTIDHFPRRESGQTYAGPDFLKALDHTIPVDEHDLMDYPAMLAELGLVQRIANDEFDEVWMFGPPYAGFYESRMVGAGAFWLNAPQIEATGRRFPIMGFNYERGVGEMLEDLGHRSESVLQHIYGDSPGPANLWQRFKRYDLVNPGQAEVGMMHWAPNSRREYEWNNHDVTVPSKCDDWLTFPVFNGVVKQVNCDEWGPDIRSHHKWWFRHLPKVAGSTNGIRDNWWSYVIRVDDPFFDPL